MTAGQSLEVEAFWNWNRDIPKDWSVTAWGEAGPVRVNLKNNDRQSDHMPVVAPSTY
jgi:hypothetical protein